MINGIVLFHIVIIPVVFMLGRLSNRIAFVLFKAKDRSSVSDFLRSRH